jgi:hypothetical protein
MTSAAGTHPWFFGRCTLVFVLALSVRLLLVWWSQSGAYVDAPTGLSTYYFRQGYAIAAGLGYVDGVGRADDFLQDIQDKVNARELVARPDTVGSPPDGLSHVTVHLPGMPLLVAGFHRILGIPADLPVQLFGAFLDSTAAAVTLWIGAIVVSPAAGAVAGLMYAFFLPQAWAATGAQMPDGLIGPFIVFMLAAYLKAIRSNGRGAYLWYGMAGLALGVGSYFRLDYLLVPLAIFPLLWLVTRRAWSAVAGTTVVIAMVFLTLLPWAYRNYLTFDEWMFTTTGAGANLVTSLGEFQNPWGIGPSDLDRLEEARAWGLESAWVPEAVPHFQRLWLDSVRSHPGAFVMTMVKRLPIALAPPFEFGFNNPLKTQTFSELRATGRDRYQVLMDEPWYVLSAYWDVLLMAALSGVALAASICWVFLEGTRWPVALLVLSPHLYAIAVHMIVHLEPRYIVGSMFTLLVGSAAMVVRRGSARYDKGRQPAQRFAAG